MNAHVPPSDRFEDECIDPGLGEDIWRLDDPGCPPDLRGRLTVHLVHCAGCRLRRAVGREIGVGLAGAGLSAAERTARPRWIRGTAWLGAAALAAGLALLMLSPPAGRRTDLTLRGEDGPAIERPTPDAVVTARQPELRWTPIPEATRYQVMLESVDGAFRWNTETDAAKARVPADASLPRDTRFRVVVTPVPGYLAPAGGLRSSFRTGSPTAWFSQRLKRGSGPGRGLLVVGLVALLASLAGTGVRRRPA